MDNRVGTCWRHFQLERQQKDESWSDDHLGPHWLLLPLLLRCLPCLDRRCSGRYLCCWLMQQLCSIDPIWTWPMRKCLRWTRHAICCCCFRSCDDFPNAILVELFYSVSISCACFETKFSLEFPSTLMTWPLRIVSVSTDIYSDGIGFPVPAIVGSWMPFLAASFCPAKLLSLLLRYLKHVKWNFIILMFTTFSNRLTIGTVIISTFQSDYCCCLKIGGKLVQLLIESLIALPLSFFLLVVVPLRCRCRFR